MKAFDDILSRCTNIEKLAQGGRKTVYSATHAEFGTIVIKHGNYLASSSLERISREVQLLNQIDSPYYPRQFEFLTDHTNREFLIIEERLDATELSNVVSRFQNDNSILKLLQELVKGLNIIWERDVIHRDIKPANILITKEGEPRIIDLGIARFLGRDSLTNSLAPHGPATVIYSAPEQLQNRKPMIGVRTDFFLLGILVLELMHGFHPFDPQHVGNNSGIVDNILNGKYVPPINRDPILEQFIAKALMPQPFLRFTNPTALADHLQITLK